MSKKSWAVDTNTLVYFLDKNSPHHQSVVDIFSRAKKSSIQLVITHQNILELIQVLTSFYHLSLKKAVSQAKSVINSSLRLIYPLPSTLSSYISLCGKQPNAHYHFDLYLAATFLDHGIDSIVTADHKPFKNIAGFKIIKI